MKKTLRLLLEKKLCNSLYFSRKIQKLQLKEIVKYLFEIVGHWIKITATMYETE